MASAAKAQTGSEIYLFDVSGKGKRIEVSNPRNITNHPGYDNQPSFHVDKPLIYYSSFNEEGRSDIKIYNFKTEETTALTTTPEREYSPTLTPDKKFISCIIQRDNHAQDLGKYPVEGGEPEVIIDNLIVGYHAWIDDTRLILFVLGDPMTLRLYDTATGKDEVLAERIGRSMHKIPGTAAMSFVLKKSEEEWTIMRLDSNTLQVTPLVNTLKGREDLTWTPDGKILMSDGEKLFVFDPQREWGWMPVPMQAGGTPLKGITRLAMSADGKKLTVVVSE